jgi:4-diphosphocytidyl-2-C-methyl-D-erythritol kinase
MRPATFQAPAKLNLLLGVTPQVVQGKHLLTTVFTTIDLIDTLTFTFDDQQKRAITIEVINAPGIEPLNLPAEQNIVYAAVEAMEWACERRCEGHLHVVIEKRIPHAAGLAGGSTDAAATLQALATFWNMSLTSGSILRAAQKTGADVPFFCYGGCALMGGSGDKLLKKLPQPVLDFVLVKPTEGILTSEAYRAFDANPQPLPDVDGLVRLLEAPNASLQDIAATLQNNLYPAACTIMPELQSLVTALKRQAGVHTALLAGSGSTIFGVCENAQVATQVAKHFEKQGYWTQTSSTLR